MLYKKSPRHWRGPWDPSRDPQPMEKVFSWEENFRSLRIEP